MASNVQSAGMKRKRDGTVSPPALSSQSRMTAVTRDDIKPENPQPRPIAASRPDLKYPAGVVLKTWAFGHERTGNDIKIEEVLEKRTLRTAVLSAFQWNTQWLFPKLELPRTKLILIMQAKTELERTARRKEIEGAEDYLQLCFPPMEGQINCMHSKLMLLFHPHKLRVVIPSANLTNYDWGETGVMENSAFIIDLPRLPVYLKADESSVADKHESDATAWTQFASSLTDFLTKQKLEARVTESLRTFDWSATANVAFVHTSGGAWYGPDMNSTGLTGLSRAVKSFGLATNNDLQIDFAASSIGSLNAPYLTQLHFAAQGRLNVGAQDQAVPTTSHPSLKGSLRIVFPTHDTVANSKGGTANAGTICMPAKYWQQPTFPSAHFRDYKSTRARMLSHNKAMYARGMHRDAQGGGVRPIAWLYVGSANMSESAWGKLVFDKTKKRVKINCRNWECGVLLPVDAASAQLPTTVARPDEQIKAGEDKGEDDGDADTASTMSEEPAVVPGEVQIPPMSVFDQIFPTPFQYPAEEYNGRRPWNFY